MNKMLHINFTDHEVTFIKEMIKNEGYRTMSEVVRLAVRDMYDKRSTRYKKPKPTGEPSPEHGFTGEQICENMGGEVFEENGIQYCRIQNGAVTNDTPLSILKQ